MRAGGSAPDHIPHQAPPSTGPAGKTVTAVASRSRAIAFAGEPRVRSGQLVRNPTLAQETTRPGAFVVA